MGMAASQARYIALTARMNDVEYEAQQINQQRLTLSNKMNEITEATYNMDVPTPPSKIDYAIENYSGKVNGSNVSVRRKNSGAFAAYVETRGSITERTSGTKGEAQKSYVPVTSFPTPESKTSVTYQGQPIESTDGVYKVLGSDESYYTFTVNNGEIQWTAGKENVPEDVQKATSAETVEGYSESAQQILQSYYVLRGDSVEHITSDMFDSDGALVGVDINSDTILREAKSGEDGTEYNTVNAGSGNTVTSHNGKKSGTVDDIPSDRTQAQEEAFQALKHSNPDYSESDLLAYYQMVTFYDGTFGFVLRSDFEQNDAAVAIFEIEQNGKYEEELPSDEYKITYSTTGGVEGITVNGKYTILETSQTFDETKYEEAMASYKYEKTVYDHEQNELNKKTSIYQRQDKQLELKLTRLDTERNALNTELEAVKKIIQDATEKGFKTFSG